MKEKNSNETDCLFCKIINEDIPSSKIYENEHTYAFLDINPVNPGHALVIPKKHFKDIFDIPSKELCEVIATVKKISEAIKTGVEADGINIIMNNKEAAGQIIFHAHIHVIPRYNDDGFRHWPGKKYKDNEEKEIAKKIKKQL